MQKRLTRKLDLEMMLSRIEPHPMPRPDLEQYTIPAGAAAIVLHIAANMHDEILGKTILDLGCGTGRLALGAAFLGAKQVIGVDVDKVAVSAALKNSVRIGLKGRVQWVTADIDAIRGSFDTALQNPPYGVQRRGADRKFLEKALETSNTVYSLHKSPHSGKAFIHRLRTSGNGVVQVDPAPFLKGFIESHGGSIKAVYAMLMTIPHMFTFHTKRRHEFVADLYVIKKGSQSP